MRKVSLLILCIMLLLVGCGNKDIRNELSERLEIDVSSGKNVEESDSHGGFHGDGLLVQKISFEDDKVLDEIKDNQNWKAFPLSRNIEALAYGVKDEIEDSVHIIGPYLTDENGEESFIEAKSEDIEENSALYNSFGQGVIFRFFDENEEEISWILEGEKFSCKEIIIEADFTDTDLAIIQPQIIVEPAE